jgi:3-hydroxybutyryl-CoA dehydrogenase
MPLNPDPRGGERLAILGPGILGISVAAFAAEQGLEVRLVGRDLAHAEAGVRKIHARWQKHLAKGRISSRTLELGQIRLRACTSLERALDGASTVLEALPEVLEMKQQAWSRIARAAAPSVLLLTGSSSLPLARIREGARLDERLIGFHVFLPLERMDALELVTEEGSDPLLVARAEALGRLLGRRILRVKDGSGYAASRLALAQGLEAMRLLERGVASAEHLDGVMVHGYGHPMGPLELSDRIGLDLRLSIARGLHRSSGLSAYEPPAILEALVRRGDLGRKSGKGFYAWNEEGRRS